MKELNTISLAGLFHDIGKLYQRCGQKLSGYNYEYTKDGKSHLHAGFTAQFFDRFNNYFSQFCEINNPDTSLQNLASYHHKPNNALQKIISIADRLSSGMERDEYEKYNSLTEEEETQQYNYKKARLLSIFSKIRLNPSYNPQEKFYQLEKLNPEIIPYALAIKDIKQAEKEYLVLKEQFEKDLKKLFEIEFNNFNNFFNAISTLLEKYLWCVPASSFLTTATVSLFDHLKTTSAISTALYLYCKENYFFEEFDYNKQIFILVQGDFSGIQNFIFSRFGESNKHSAKILRAKSFFVSVFTEIAAYRLIQEFNSNSSSIILNAGGKFTLILPALKDYEKKIEKVYNEINKFFRELTYGQTSFNIAYVKLSGNDFVGKKISDKFSELNYNLQCNKLKPYIENPIFEEYLEKVSFAGGVCDIDGYLPKKQGSNYSEISEMFMNIGKLLPKVDFINIYFSQKGKFQLLNRGITFSLEKSPDKDADLIFKINPDAYFTGFAEKMLAYYVPVFTEEDLKLSKYAEIPEKIFDQSDFEEGGVKTFYHIAADAMEIEIINGKEEHKGKSFLGVLKADIDNLGNIFSKGLGEKTSIADIVYLSRMLDYFFTGWLMNEIKKNFKSVYTVFAGGDDLFLIGPYNQIIELSKRMSEHLKEYSAENEDIHISAGIILKKPEVPVYQMAETSEEALSMAKSQKGKNSITIFDITLKWNEFIKLYDLVSEIDNFFEKGVTNAYIYNILKLIDMHEKLKKGKLNFNNRKNALWIAYLNYFTIRNYKDKLREDLLDFFYKSIINYGEKLIIPISLSLYKRRK